LFFIVTEHASTSITSKENITVFLILLFTVVKLQQTPACHNRLYQGGMQYFLLSQTRY
jgi:hypothetical protein